MLRYLKEILAHTCPECKQLLLAERSVWGIAKTCPIGHYKEETFHHLGVRVVYK